MNELTIGVEEEYQIVDPDSRELTSYIQEFLEKGSIVLRDQIKPEFMQSQVEVGSQVCRDIKEVRLEVMRLRRMVADLADKHDRKIISAGTHPFSHWEDQEVTERPRYGKLLDKMRFPAKRLLVFGMHVHIGISDPALRIDIMNQMRYFMPHILALSTSSPFWLGHDTGLKSYRSIIFSDLPRTGIPRYFNSYDAYERLTETFIKTGCIEEATQIWWDLRPHPTFPTLEFRFCDGITKIDEVVAVTALIQALVHKLIQLQKSNQSWRIYRSELIEENKWRAARHGLHGKLLDLGKEKEVPVHFLINEMLDLVDDVVDDLGSRAEIEYIHKMLVEGSSADRQLRTYYETGDLQAVVDMLADETIAGC